VSPKSDDCCVIGAGALGLTTALRLAESGRRVAVLESEPLPGGLAAGFQVESGAWLERFYHHIFRSDRAAIRLIDELGLSHRLQWMRPRTVTLRQGRVYQLDSALSLLRFSPISPASRLRMGAVLAWLRLLPNPGLLEGHRAGPWLRHAMGEAGFESVWGPLLRGKFGPYADDVALPWFWARVHDRSSELGYLSGGFQQLYDALRERILECGGEIEFGATVQRIEAKRDGLEVQFSRAEAGRQSDSSSLPGPGRGEASVKETRSFKRVVSTLATPTTCALAVDLGDAYRTRYGHVRALSAHCLVLSLDRPVTDSYWINIADPGYPFLAAVEHTNLMPPGDYGGTHLLYLGNYRPPDDPLFAMSAGDVLTSFTPLIRGLNPEFDPSWVRAAWVFSAPNAQPIVDIAYKRNIPDIETPVKGLFVANMFQVYPHDRGQNGSIVLGEGVARRILAG
jgi:protoporphyrinogen oxidase